LSSKRPRTLLPAPGERDAGSRVALTRRSIPVVFYALALVVAACSNSGTNGSGQSTTAAVPAQRDIDALVDVGDGRQIYAKCQGQGSPTVVLIAGKGNGAEDWQQVLDPDDPAHDAPGDDVPWGLGRLEPSDASVFSSVARFTRVCTYDRPDIRFDAANVTTSRQQPHTVDLDVSDLHALLTALGEPRPYVLVSHSYGGLIAVLYARMYPENIGGLVMVDTVTQLMADVASPAKLENWDATNSATSPQVREGVKLIDAFEQINAAPALQPVAAVVLCADKPWRIDLLPADATQGEMVTFADWLASLDLLAIALGAENITQTNSGHDIYLYNPALVVDAIHRVIDDAREDAMPTPR
jgi:pimeloyl-ACP methyl ester carboxylesterase